MLPEHGVYLRCRFDTEANSCRIQEEGEREEVSKVGSMKGEEKRDREGRGNEESDVSEHPPGYIGALCSALSL